MKGKVKLHKVGTNHTEVPNASAIWVYKEREKEKESERGRGEFGPNICEKRIKIQMVHYTAAAML